MPRDVLVVGYPPEWVQSAMQVTQAILAKRFGGEIQVRSLGPTAPELAAYPEVRAHLATPGVQFPLVAVDGRVVTEGQFSAGLITAYLVYGHIPKVPEGHMVSQALPAEGRRNLPGRGVRECVGRWWRRWWRRFCSWAWSAWERLRR